MKQSTSLRDAIVNIKPREFVRLEQVPPSGTLELRKSGQGVLSFYWRTTYQGKSSRYLIGLYDSSAPPKSSSPSEKGFSLNAARAAASEMAAKHISALAEGGYESVVENRKAKAKAKQEAEAAAGYTLEKLYDLYVTFLATRNKETAKQARNLFLKNIKSAFPDVAKNQANKVTTEQIAEVLRRISSEGKKTTARKLKAYLSSAFTMAKNVENNISISDSFKVFKIKHNPVADIAGITQGHGSDKNPLLPDEMRKYWEIINIPGKKAALLRLHLLLGGQRIEQLLRLLNRNTQDEQVILLDTKGRSGMERQIVIPLIPPALEALQELRSDGEFLISVTKGKCLSSSTARTWSEDVVGDHITNFTLKRVRSGVATLLSKLKVDAEVRNHIQSHNLHGIEHKHYNMHDFFDEKKEALNKMHQFLANKNQINQ